VRGRERRGEEGREEKGMGGQWRVQGRGRKGREKTTLRTPVANSCLRH